MAYLPKNNLAYPVLIEIGAKQGSGFFYVDDTALYLATAQHNLFDKNAELVARTAVLSCFQSDLVTKVHASIDCEQLLKSSDLRKSNTSDIAVAKIGTVTNMQVNYAKHFQLLEGSPKNPAITGIHRKSLTLFDEVEISNDVVMFGYPTSLSTTLQLDRARPLIRRGCVAGKTENRRLVIDCPSYFGNSGGLVIEVTDDGKQRKYRGIGVAVEMVPFAEELWSKQFNRQVGTRFENSGYTLVEPIDRVLELIK